MRTFVLIALTVVFMLVLFNTSMPAWVSGMVGGCLRSLPHTLWALPVALLLVFVGLLVAFGLPFLAALGVVRLVFGPLAQSEQRVDGGNWPSPTRKVYDQRGRYRGEGEERPDGSIRLK